MQELLHVVNDTEETDAETTNACYSLNQGSGLKNSQMLSPSDNIFLLFF